MHLFSQFTQSQENWTGSKGIRMLQIQFEAWLARIRQDRAIHPQNKKESDEIKNTHQEEEDSSAQTWWFD